MKPQLANNVNLKTLQFPVIAQPKIDGVRAINLDGTLTGRSLKKFDGYGVTEYFSKSEYRYLDGEMILGNDPRAEHLCNLTTGALSSFKGVTEMKDIHWFVFDYLKDPNLPYYKRYEELRTVVNKLNSPRIHLIPSSILGTERGLLDYIGLTLEQGFEGVIIRNPNCFVKEGRPSKKQELVRYKPWQDSEILVTGVTEGNTNTSLAVINELGYIERSLSLSGMVPNGMVGSLQGVILEDVFSCVTGSLLFPKGLEVTISKGCMSHCEARHYFENQSLIVGSIVKFKFMAYGCKDLPRMGGYLSHRMAVDLS